MRERFVKTAAGRAAWISEVARTGGWLRVVSEEPAKLDEILAETLRACDFVASSGSAHGWSCKMLGIVAVALSRGPGSIVPIWIPSGTQNALSRLDVVMHDSDRRADAPLQGLIETVHDAEHAARLLLLRYSPR